MELLRVTPALLDLLRQRRIFHHRSGADRWAPGDVVGAHPECEIEPYAQLFAGHVIPRTFGAFSYARSAMSRNVRLGRYCSLGEDIAWMGPSHPTGWASTSPVTYDHDLPAVRAFRTQYDPDGPPPHEHPAQNLSVHIGHDVWIGDGAMIAPGVTIGHGAVVGARALVLKDAPPYAIVVGAPARVLRMRFPDPLVARFLALQWWRFTPAVIQPLPVDDPERFLDALEERLGADPPTPIRPVPLRFAEIKAACEATA